MYRASKPEARRILNVLTPFAVEDVAVRDTGGEEGFVEFVKLLTEAEDALNEHSDTFPAMVLCDWLEEKGLLPEMTSGLRAVLNSGLVNPRPEGTRLTTAAERAARSESHS